MLTGFSTKLRLDSETLGRGTEFSLEGDLGYDSSLETGRYDMFYRLARKHRVEFSYFDIERNTTRVLDKELQIGEVVFPVNTTLGTFFDTEIYKGSYTYAFLPYDTWEIGASLGLHVMRLGLGASASGMGLAQSFTAPLPLPVVGLRGEWAFAHGWRAYGFTQALYVKLRNISSTDEIEGVLTDNVIGIEHEILDHVTLGLSYNYFFMNVSAARDSLTLAADYGYSGVLLTLGVAF